MKRPPIIVIMGSVDHGKTTLLDYIRKTTVAAKEAGGITQSIGAYEIEHTSAGSAQAQKITFIDTPGHEAFGKMKARGAQIADIAILVVAADDGVQPQTKEAIRIIKESDTTFVVAINKIDRVPDVNKIKNELLQAGVLLEGYGGDISFQPISAKTGDGVNELLDLVLLASELEHLDYDPSHLGKGYILESKLDSRSGILATAIVKDGTIRVGDEIRTDDASGKTKILENFLGKSVKEAGPSSPIRIIGFETLPAVGQEFLSGPKLEERVTAVAGKVAKKIRTAEEKSENAVRIILKADVTGSLEALSQIIKHLPLKPGQVLEIIDESIGEITEGDVNHAVATKSLIIGFKTKSTKTAEALARAKSIKIVQSEIVYDLLKAVDETLSKIGKKIISGRLEILAVFGKKNSQQIIGGRVIEGSISNNAGLEVERKGQEVGSGKVVNLQQTKKDVKSVEAGKECGLLFTSAVEIKVGDHLLAR